MVPNVEVRWFPSVELTATLKREEYCINICNNLIWQHSNIKMPFSAPELSAWHLHAQLSFVKQWSEVEAVDHPGAKFGINKDQSFRILLVYSVIKQS